MWSEDLWDSLRPFYRPVGSKLFSYSYLDILCLVHPHTDKCRGEFPEAYMCDDIIALMAEESVLVYSCVFKNLSVLILINTGN